MPQKLSINKLSEDTGLDRRTVKALLKSTKPAGKDSGHPIYWLHDLIAAIGNKERRGISEVQAARLRKLGIESELLEMERAQQAGELIRASVARLLWDEVIVLLREKILAFPKLTDEEKADLMAALRNIGPDEYFEDKISKMQAEEGEPA